MPPEDAELGSPSQWLAYALSDLVLAKRAAEPGVLPASLCFHAQQAAEKSLKAVLVHRGIGFPRTHNLSILMGLLPQDCDPPDAVRIAELTAYAVAARYPGVGDDITEEHRRAAAAAAQATHDWAVGLTRS